MKQDWNRDYKDLQKHEIIHLLECRYHVFVVVLQAETGLGVFPKMEDQETTDRYQTKQ